MQVSLTTNDTNHSIFISASRISHRTLHDARLTTIMGHGICSRAEGHMTNNARIPDGIRPGVRLWAAFSVLALVALTIIFDAGDFVVIQKSLGRNRQGSVKEVHENGTAEGVSVSEAEKDDSIATRHALNRTNASYLTDVRRPISPSKSGNSSNAATSIKQIVDQSHEAAAAANIVSKGTKLQSPTHILIRDNSSLVTAPLVSTPTSAMNTHNAMKPPPTITTAKTTPSPKPKSPAKVASVVNPPTLSCRRSCRHYNNKILLSTPPRGGAGLNDRMYVIGRTLQLAGYLCAKLYMARPKFWLAPGHNQGEEVDVRMTWGDFGDFRLFDDDSNSSALVDWVNQDDINMLPLVSKIKRSYKYRQWLYVRTEREIDTVAHFEQIESFTFSQAQNSTISKQQPQGFLWEILPDFYGWSRFLRIYMQQNNKTLADQPHLLRVINVSTTRNASLAWRNEMRPVGWQLSNEGCPYVGGGNPKDIVRMVQNMFDRIHNVTSSSSGEHQSNNNNTTLLTRPWIGYFHVRRGDTIAQCNTTLERIQKFLSCSVGEPLSALAKAKQEEGPKRHVILLLSSDERNADYRRELGRLVEQQQELYPLVNTAFQVSFADLDDLLRREISTFNQQGIVPAWRLNNLYLYRLISYVEWGRPEITFRLEQRRSTCPACANITQQLVRKDALLWD